jgi:hypothetical protein
VASDSVASPGHELDLGPVPLERLTERRQRVEPGAPVVGDAERAELSETRASGGGDGRFGVSDSATRTVQKRVAGFGQPDFPAVAVEQARADLLLELSNRHAQRWLRHSQAPSRAAEVELFGHGDEVAEVTKLRHRMSVLRSDTRSVPSQTGSVFRRASRVT